MDSFWWIAGAVFSALYTAIGVVGNGLTIAILVKFRQFRNAIGFCVLSLTLADLVRCVFITPTNLSFFINMGKLSFSLLACMLYRVTAYAALTVSGYSISLIAFNRCIKICCKKGTYENIFKDRNVLCMILLIWVSSIALPIFVCQGIGGNIKHDGDEGTCAFDFSKGTSTVYTCSFVLTASIVVICYARIYFTVARSRRMRSANTQLSNQLDDQVNSHLLKMLLATTVTYFLSFALPMLIGLVYFIEGKDIKHADSPMPIFIFKVTIHVGVIVNPVIYGVTNKTYREAYKILFHDAFERCRHCRPAVGN